MGIKRQNNVKAEGAMSSMTDLVFLLLIFFVILSTMATTGVEVNVPDSDTTNNVASDKTTVAVKLENGIPRVYVNEREFTYVNRATNAIDKQQLGASISAVLGDKKIVELKAAEDIPYIWPAQVIDVVKQNKWTIVLVYETR